MIQTFCNTEILCEDDKTMTALKALPPAEQFLLCSLNLRVHKEIKRHYPRQFINYVGNNYDCQVET